MQIPDLTLPASGGIVKFRNDDDLTRAEYRRLRAVYAPSDLTDGALQTVMAEASLATLIIGWDMPGLPGLPLPRWSEDGKTVEICGLDAFRMEDTIALDIAVQDFIAYVIRGVRPAAPKARSTGSDSSSAATPE